MYQVQYKYCTEDKMNNYKNLIELLREHSMEVNPGIAALMLNAANALEISSQTIYNHDSKYCGERMNEVVL